MLTINSNRMSAELARQARLASNVAAAQLQISTGKRLQTPSEDPSASVQIGQIARAQADNSTWQSNIALCSTLASQADRTLGTLSDTLVQARELMMAGMTGTATAADRATIGSRMRSLADQVTDLASTQTIFGQPLFPPGTPMSIRVGSDELAVPVAGAADVFETNGASIHDQLIDAAAALENNDLTRMNAALGKVSSCIDHVADAWAAQGNTAARLSFLAERAASNSSDLELERSGLEDVDIAKAVATLNAKTLTLEAAQAAFARLNRRTLFDILG